jgi:hypothetical protein
LNYKRSDDVPVVIIIFRRPEQTRRLVDALRIVKPKRVYVIADGARAGVEGETELVLATRAEINRIDWDSEVIKVYSDSNLALRERVLSGLDYVFEREHEAIILEDDCIPASSFFEFSGQLLERYREDQAVGMISGSNFSPSANLPSSYFFYSGSFIWGWATWARFWNEFRASPQVEAWDLAEQKTVMDSFASPLAARIFKPMMKNAGNLNTWDISLDVYMRLNGFLSAVPKNNLIANVGFGEGATHTKFTPLDSQSTAIGMDFPLLHPGVVQRDSSIEKRMWRSRLIRWVASAGRHPVKIAIPVLRRLLGK